MTPPKLAGLHPAESTVERATEAAGKDLGDRLAAGETFGPARGRARHRDAEGKTRAYVAIDATGVGQQGPGGAAAAGRMAAVAMVYSPVPGARARRARPDGPPPRFRARYLAGLGGAAALGEPRRRQAAQVGMDRAERRIGLSDGGAGLEEWLRANFGRLGAVILDFYHAAEHLGALARALYPGDDEARGGWLSGWCGRLKREGGAAVLEGLKALAVRGGAARRGGEGGGGAVLRRPGAPDGLPGVPGPGLGDRVGAGGGGVQGGRRPAEGGLGDAVGRRGDRRGRPPAGAVQGRGPAVRRLLGPHRGLIYLQRRRLLTFRWPGSCRGTAAWSRPRAT